jgi:hypothetical protein
MVRQEKTLDAGRGRDPGDIRPGAVSPVFPRGIFFGRVLRVVDDDVRILHEQSVPAIAVMQDGSDRPLSGIGVPKGLPVRLVVAQVKQRGAVGLNAITQRDSGVVQ